MRYKSHNTNSIPKQFIRINVRHHTLHKHHTPASQYHSQNKTIQCLIPVTNLVATFSNDFVRRLLGAHAPRGTNAKNCTHDRRLGVVWIPTETVPKPLKTSGSIDIIRVTKRDRDGGGQTALKKQRVSIRGVCVLVSTQQWQEPSFFCLKGYVRVRDSTDNTSWQEASEFLCIRTLPFLREFSNELNRQKFPEMLCQSDALLMSRFQRIARF